MPITSAAFMTDPTDPRLPQDIERVITEVLVNDHLDMAGTMSLVAARFRTWHSAARAKSETLRTVVIRHREHWTQRISDLFLPNAHLIQILVIDLPSTLSEEELLHIQRLLQGAEKVKHLAVGWHIWEHFVECGFLQLESLCLIWDEARQMDSPHLGHLQHPSLLRNVTIYAPPRPISVDARNSAWAQFNLPATILDDFPNLASLTYAARNEVPDSWGCEWDTEGKTVVHTWTMGVRTASKGFKLAGEAEFSTVYFDCSNEVLRDWLRRREGRRDGDGSIDRC
ncbi:hypothetical protein DFH06DRAFT_1128651 [Mycena polygramma]|nr:hypothetical protein DFH06DRAFT_1128651 [Mycena polygramma]